MRGHRCKYPFDTILLRNNASADFINTCSVFHFIFMENFGSFISKLAASSVSLPQGAVGWSAVYDCAIAHLFLE